MIEQTPDISEQQAQTTNPNWVPWTALQTFRGVLFTLVPWVAFNLIGNTLGGGTTTNQPITRAEDLAGAFIVFLFTGITEGLFLIAPYYYAKKALAQLQTSMRAIFLALGLRRFHAGKILPLIFGLLVLVIGINILYSYILSILPWQIQTNDQVLLQEGVSQPLTVYGLLLGSVFLAPFCEEIFFRGFVFTGVLRDLSPAWAIVISAALFTIAHVDPGSSIPLFAIGLALGFLRWKSGSTWAGMILHMLNNLLASILVILSLHHINLPF